MPTIVDLQYKATKAPADGKAYLEDVLTLDYVYSDTGTALEIPLPATATNPILVQEVTHAVKTLFSGGTPAIDVGDGTTAGFYIANTAVAEGTAGDVVGSATTAKKYLTAAGKVKVTLSGGLAAGAGKVIVRVARF